MGGKNDKKKKKRRRMKNWGANFIFATQPEFAKDNCLLPGESESHSHFCFRQLMVPVHVRSSHGNKRLSELLEIVEKAIYVCGL